MPSTTDTTATCSSGAANSPRRDRCSTIYTGLDRRHLRGCARADLARVHRAERQFDPAVLDGLEAMRFLDRGLEVEFFDRTLYRLCSSIRRAERLKPRIAVRLGQIRRRRYTHRQLPWVQHRWAEGVVFLRLDPGSDRAIGTLRGVPSRLLALGDLRGGSLAATDLVDLHLASGFRDDAVAVARTLLAELRSLDAEPGLVETVRRCAEAALEPLGEARERFQKLGDAGDRNAAGMAMKSLTETGDCLQALGRLDEAAAAYEESIRLAEALEDRRGGAVARGQLGTVRMGQQRYDEALNAFNDARKTFEELGEPGTVAGAWHQIGRVYEEAGQYEAAEQAYQQSLKIWVQRGDRPHESDTLDQLGALYAGRGRGATAAGASGLSGASEAAAKAAF